MTQTAYVSKSILNNNALFFLSILLSNLGVIEDVQTFHVPHLCNN